MAVAEADSSLVEQVLSGGNRDLKVLAARGLLPLSPDQLVPLQVRLAGDEDPEVAGRARTALRLTEPRLLADYLAAEAGEEELEYFSREADHPQVVEAMLRRRDIPRRVLITLAPRLEPALQEILVLRQDAIVEEPAILDALEENPRLERYVQRRVGEYRQHLLPREQAEEAPPEGDEEEEHLEEAPDEVVQAAIAEAVSHPADGEMDEVTGLTEGQVRVLPVPVRLRLARGASRTLRSILVRDTNPRVATAVLDGGGLSEEEVEQFARNRSVAMEVLEAIGRRREWVGRYAIVNALVSNPRAPVGIAVRLLPRLSVRDLRGLSKNRNVADAVRAAAKNVYTAKTR